jgi:hypothetical protein
MNPIALADSIATTGVQPEAVSTDKVQTVEFYSHFKRQNELLTRRQAEYWKPLFLKWLRHALYYDGKQTLIPRGNGFGYDVRAIKDKNRVYQVNRLRPYSDDQTSMWMSVNPKIQLLVVDTNEETQQRKLDAFTWLQDHFNYQLFTPEFLQKCAKAAQFCGPYHAENWWDNDNRKGEEFVRTYQDVVQQPRQLASCLACGNVGEPMMRGTIPTCGSCQSPYVDIKDLPGASFQLPRGADWQKAGDVELIHDETWHRRYSLTVGVRFSPWLYHERDEVRETVEAKYGKLQGNYTDTAWMADEMMHPGRIMRRAERERGPSTSSDTYSDDECMLVQRFYYEPEMLHFIKLDKPVTSTSGFTIPANVRISEIVKDAGLCIKTSPGLPYFLDFYLESHKKRFVNGQYGITPGKQIAHGNDEAPDYQKYLNVLHSGAFTNMLQTMQPSTAVIEEVFPDGNLFNREDRTVRVKKAQIENFEGGLGAAYLPLVPPGLNKDVFTGMQFFGGELQRSTKSDTYLSSSDQGVDPNTATAARIGEGRTMRANSLHLALFADFLKDCTISSLELAKARYGEMRRVTVSDEQARRRVAKIVRGTDLQAEVRAYVEEGSYLPDLKIEQRAAYKEGMEVFSVGIQAGFERQSLIKSINRHYGIDLAADRNAERLTSCEELLEFAREAVAMGAADPLAIYLLNPVDTDETNHEAQLMWWRVWKGTPEGKRAHPILRAVAKLYIQAHAAAFMEDRMFVATAAQIGVGLIAPPNAAGLQPTEQKPPAAPMPGNDAQFASDALANNQPMQ